MAEENEKQKSALRSRMYKLGQRNQEWQDFEKFVLNEFKKIQGDLQQLRTEIANQQDDDARWSSAYKIVP